MLFLTNKFLIFNFLNFILSTQIGIEFKKQPRLIKSNLGIKREFEIIEHFGFKINDNDIKLVKELNNDCVYNISDIPENEFNLENIAGITKEGEQYVLKGFDTKIDKISFISLFISKILKKYKINKDSSINISSRDYYNKEQMEILNKSISNLEVRSKVIPESVSALSFLLEENLISLGKFFIVNFRGTKCMGSLYEITEDKGIKIKLLEKKEIEGISDYLIEVEIYKYISEIVKSKLTKNASFLPYEPLNTEFYCDLSKIMTDVYDKLGTQLNSYTFLEIYCYDKDKNKIEVASKIDIDLNFLRNKIESLINISINIPDGAKGYLMTDYMPRIKVHENLLQVSEEAIFKGLHTLFGANIAPDEELIDKNFHLMSSNFMAIKREIKTKHECKVLFSELKEKIKQLKYLSEEELKPLKRFEENPKDLKKSEELLNTWNTLFEINRKKESKKEIRKMNIKMLEGLINTTENINKEIKEIINSDFLGIKEWFEQNKDNEEVVDEFNKKYIQLQIIIRKAEKKLEAIREKENKAQEKTEEQDFKIEEGNNKVESKEERSNNKEPNDKEREQLNDNKNDEQLNDKKGDQQSNKKEKPNDDKKEEQQRNKSKPSKNRNFNKKNKELSAQQNENSHQRDKEQKVSEEFSKPNPSETVNMEKLLEAINNLKKEGFKFNNSKEESEKKEEKEEL